MRGHRYDPDRQWGEVGTNWFEQPDAVHAQNDYGAAMRDLDPEADRPPFVYDDWRTADAEPTHPAWACQGCELHPAEPEPGYPEAGPYPDPFEPKHLRPGRWWSR